MEFTHWRQFLGCNGESRAYHRVLAWQREPRRGVGGVLPLLMTALLAGCVSSGNEGGAAIAKVVAGRLAVAGTATGPAPTAEPAPLPPLPSPLARQDALAWALAHSPHARALAAHADADAAEVRAMTLPGNPTVALSRLTAPGGGAELTRSIAIELASLLVWPATRERASALALHNQHKGIAELLHLGRSVEMAWLNAAAAERLAAVAAEDRGLAEERAELARRYRAAGNLDEAHTAAAEARAATAVIAVEQAEIDALQARRELADLLGVPMTEDWRIAVPWTAPTPVTIATDPLLAAALRDRDDLRAAEAALAERRTAWQLNRRFGWLGGLAVGYEHERTSGEGSRRGPAVELELPLFERGQTRRLNAAARWRMASAERDALRTQITNEVRTLAAETFRRQTIAAAYAQRLKPALATAFARKREQVDFMLDDVFALMDARAEEYAAARAQVLAERDVALAQTRLRYAVGGSWPDAASTTPSPETRE